MDNQQIENLFDKVVALAKRRGFIFPGSEIYGGVANTYDYGPTGTELLRNIKNAWWKNFIQEKVDMVGLDSSIISSYRVWDASGHTAGFADSMIDCKSCKLRKRADHLIEDFIEENLELVQQLEKTDVISSERLLSVKETGKVEGWTIEELDELINLLKIPCPNCKKRDWTAVRKFNQLFPVRLGIVEGDQSLAYLRGETAQGIFINFKNVVDSSRVRLPFGIGQIGKSFRNEITLGNSVFRTIEFEQAEIEYFFDPEKTPWEPLFEDWKSSMFKFITFNIGIKEDNLRWRTHTDEERSFYSQRTEDLEYKFPWGFKELWGIAYRTDYDLTQHIKHSGKELFIIDPETNQKVVPHVIEPAVGINRIFLMALCDAYREDEKRVWLALKPSLAPFKAAIFPLVSNKPELVDRARDIYLDLKKQFMVTWDDRGNIGKRYASQDEIGTPFCITVDYQTLEDETVTIRDRDTAVQERVKISELTRFIGDKVTA